MTGKIVARIVAALVLIAAVGGIAFFAFQAGVAQGSPVTITAPDGVSAPAPYYYGYGMHYRHPFGFGLGCFGPILAIFLFVLVLKSFRMLLWGPRWGWGHRGGHGPWGRHHWENGIPPMFEEWHKKAHGETTEDKKE